MTYAVFDLGAIFYWLVPTAPPWYAEAGESEREAGSSRAGTSATTPVVRRMMAEYGEHFWRDRWGPLYSVLGGNPLAAMPSLHFATSLMAALLLAEVGLVAGAFGFAYTVTLGFALVYLGEHYLVDLLAGAALTGAVRRVAPRAAPLARRFAHAVAAIEGLAHEGARAGT
jgi:membrane-associated phospholipid phosphatase